MTFDFDAAVFDMDGTLLDTMRYWRYTTLEFLLAHQMPVRNEDLVRMYDSSSRRLLFEIAEREGVDIGTKEEVVRELEGYMNRHYLYDARVKDPHIPAFLQKLKESGVRCCVATGSPREFARNGLGRLGLLPYFEFVTDNYENGITKDKTEYFIQLTQRLGVEPRRCMVFEDALYAMEAAKNAGCRVTAIEEGTARRQKEAIQKLADRYIRSYSELL